MKKVIYSLLFIFTIVTVNAQSNKNYKSFYKKFKKEQRVFGISAPISVANWFIDNDEKELKSIIKRGRKVRLLVFSEEDFLVFNEINKYLSENLYEMFFSIKDKDSRVKILVRENKKRISEIILLIKDKTTFVTLGIYGDFTYDDLNRLSKESKRKGSEKDNLY